MFSACYPQLMSQTGMLSALRIENLAIVDRAELLLGPGLTVLTGETGAGKSILVDALGLVLGGRADTELVRTGATEAVVEALFELPAGSSSRARFEAAGIDVSGGEVVVRRVLGRTGRGRVTLNGQMATVGMLAELARGLVDVSGQHEHVSLLDAERHLDLVDGFGGHAALVEAYARAHAEVVAHQGSLSRLDVDASEQMRRLDFLRFQLEEIATVAPVLGELEELEAERRRLQHAGRLAEATRRAEARLYSDDGAVVEAVGRVQVELAQLLRLDERLGPLVGTASTALAELEDLAQALGRYSRALEADPGRLAEVDERVEALKRLTRKHGGSLEAVLTARDGMAAELDGIVNQDVRRAEVLRLLEAALSRPCSSRPREELRRGGSRPRSRPSWCRSPWVGRASRSPSRRSIRRALGVRSAPSWASRPTRVSPCAPWRRRPPAESSRGCCWPSSGSCRSRTRWRPTSSTRSTAASAAPWRT